MFERFTPSAIKVIMLAQEEARRLGHNYVGTEQILLALLGERSGIAAKVLTDAGLNLKQARFEVEKLTGRGSGFVSVEIPFSLRAKKLLELSWQRANTLGHNYIGTEHLMLGLLDVDDGTGVRVLENLEISTKELRDAVITQIDRSQLTPRDKKNAEPPQADSAQRLKDEIVYWQVQLERAHRLEREALAGEKKCREALEKIEKAANDATRESQTDAG